MTTATVTETCKHDLHWKYESIGGQTLCEMCARVDGGWTECTSISCDVLTPPKERRCEAHGADEIIQCPTCKGTGEEEIDCTHCDGLGYEDAECGQCGGFGEINKEDAE